MKKLFLFSTLLLLMAMPLTVLGAGNQVQNQNQVQVQNQGETTQLNVATQERERSEFGPTGTPAATGAQTRTRANLGVDAPSYMNQVYQRMQQLATGSATMRGVGPQVKKMAQEQVQAQEQIQNELRKMNTRSGLMKKLFGQDRGAVKNLWQQVEQNQVRIRTMQELHSQVQNQADQAQLSEAIKVMQAQNTALQERLQVAESEVGLFGWFFSLFDK